MRNPKRQECKRFAEIYLLEAGLNATKAAKMLVDEIGRDLSSTQSIARYGCDLLHNEKTQQEIQNIRDKLEEEGDIHRGMIIFNLREIAFDKEQPNSDRLKAIDLLNKIGGFYKDNLNIRNEQTIELVIE